MVFHTRFHLTFFLSSSFFLLPLSPTTASPIPVVQVTVRQLLVISTRALVRSKCYADTKLFRSIWEYYRKYPKGRCTEIIFIFQKNVSLFEQVNWEQIQHHNNFIHCKQFTQYNQQMYWCRNYIFHKIFHICFDLSWSSSGIYWKSIKSFIFVIQTLHFLTFHMLTNKMH